MKKIIKKYGNSVVVLFDKEDQKIYNLKEGDVIEFEIKKEGKNGTK
jgi:antitoxin component of MazEF toxin-antitoxin module